MKFITHMVFANLIAIGINYFFLSSLDKASFVIASFFSILPDLDYMIRKFEHRRETHSLLAWIILNLLLIPLFVINMRLGLIASFSYLSHIFLDMLTIRGVLLFYPWSRKRYVLLDPRFLIEEGSNWEIALMIIFIGISFYLYNYLFTFPYVYNRIYELLDKNHVLKADLTIKHPRYGDIIIKDAYIICLDHFNNEIVAIKKSDSNIVEIRIDKNNFGALKIKDRIEVAREEFYTNMGVAIENGIVIKYGNSGRSCEIISPKLVWYEVIYLDQNDNTEEQGGGETSLRAI